MNWRAGFVRAWVVLAALWVLLCLVLASGPGEHDDLIVKYGNHSWASLYLGRIIARMGEPSGLLVILGPPAAIFCLGGLVAWIIAGFGRSNSN